MAYEILRNPKKRLPTPSLIPVDVFELLNATWNNLTAEQ
ncbi:MAG: hypothetical protein OJF52_001079 [Nitrospira sp.]|nr:MAG: hypothetical protein OJF52_001079 [Nitrospira sp.]